MSDDTNPPRLNGEMISMGTRKPNPIGPLIAVLPITVGSGTAGAVTYSPGVPGGAVTGGNVIKKSAIFIEGHQQKRLRPERWDRG